MTAFIKITLGNSPLLWLLEKRIDQKKCTFIATKNWIHRFTMSTAFLILDGFFHKTEKVPVNPHKQK